MFAAYFLPLSPEFLAERFGLAVLREISRFLPLRRDFNLPQILRLCFSVKAIKFNIKTVFKLCRCRYKLTLKADALCRENRGIRSFLGYVNGSIG